MNLFSFHISTTGTALQIFRFSVGVYWYHPKYGPYLLLDLGWLYLVAGARGVFFQRAITWHLPCVMKSYYWRRPELYDEAYKRY